MTTVPEIIEPKCLSVIGSNNVRLEAENIYTPNIVGSVVFEIKKNGIDVKQHIFNIHAENSGNIYFDFDTNVENFDKIEWQISANSLLKAVTIIKGYVVYINTNIADTCLVVGSGKSLGVVFTDMFDNTIKTDDVASGNSVIKASSVKNGEEVIFTHTIKESEGIIKTDNQIEISGIKTSTKY